MSSKEIRIDIVGRTGAGRSAFANLLSDGNSFESTLSGISVTSECKKVQIEVDEKTLIIVDTPGLFHTRLSNKLIEEEIRKSVKLLSPGPHVFLYVLRIGRYTEEEEETFMRLLDICGEELYKHLIIIFTGKDHLQGRELEDHIKEIPIFFRHIIEKSNKRVIAVNNYCRESDRRKTIQTLLSVIKNMQLDVFTENMLKETNYLVMGYRFLRKIPFMKQELRLQAVRLTHDSYRRLVGYMYIGSCAFAIVLFVCWYDLYYFRLSNIKIF